MGSSLTRNYLPAPALIAACAVTIIAACVDGRSDARVTVVDSSGVRITISPEADDLYARIDTPAIVLGGADAAGPGQFYNIQGLYVDDAGNIWVANRGSNELRIFRADGTHWKTVGRSGTGPGEFRQIRLLGRFRDNRVALWDDGNPRLTLVTGNGDIDSVHTLVAGGTVPRADAVLPDDALLVRFPRVIAAASLATGAVIPDTSVLFRYDLGTNAVAELATVSGPVWIWTGRFQVPVPFTIKAAVAADSAGALHIADGPEFRIHVLHTGVTRESYGVSRPPRAVTDADRAVYRRFFESNLTDPDMLRAYLSSLDHPDLPERLPAYSQILIDDRGRTWALIYSPDPLAGGMWDVYGPDRQLLGMARTQPGLIVHAVVGNGVIGVWRDELGVESVQLYQFTTQ